MYREKVYSYRIHTKMDEKIFYQACESIEKFMENLKKEELLSDILDDSLIQRYFFEDKEI